MADDTTRLQALETLLRKLEDIANSQAALVEKIATALTQAEEAGLSEIGEKLSEPFSNASRNADLVRELRGEIEKVRDRLKAG